MTCEEVPLANRAVAVTARTAVPAPLPRVRVMHLERAIDAPSALSLTADLAAAADPGGRPVRGWYPPIRVAAETVATLILLVIAAPVMLLAAVAVRVTSRGPAVYSQVRLGFRGRPFSIYKIRSMSHNCEQASGPCWATAHDPRITRVGRFLRATHIDELPQLWNVLRGDMSLIGPRPERPSIARDLERAIPRYGERVRVRPGITGFAQVQLPYDSDVAGVRCKLTYDLYYIESASPWLDVRILVSTAMKMVGMPFSVIHRVCAMPSVVEVERKYRGAAVPIRPALQLQPA